MRTVWLIAASTTLVVASFSMFNPVLAVLLQQRGHGTTAIGAFAMIPFACVALLIPFMPQVFARCGIGRCYLVGLILESVSTLGYIAFDGLALWSTSAVVGGIGAAAVWNATEALLAQHAPPGERGHVMGLYQTALGGALAAGPFVPALLQWSAHITLVVAAMVQFASLALVISTGIARRHGTQPLDASEHTPQPRGTWGAARMVPVLVGMAFVGGVFEAGLSSISAAHGANSGLSMAQATSIVGVLGLGSFLCQYPAGWAADRFVPHKVFTAVGVALLLSAIAFAWGTSHNDGNVPLWVLWATALVWGGMGGALYTLSMIRVAHRFKAPATAAGAAAMIIGYTLGGAVGPVISGAALQHGGGPGLALWLGALAVAVMVLSRRNV
jgi:MFS family permease